MAKVRIEYLSDTCDCETCGSSYAEGYRVLVDGEEITCLEPIADCFGGQTFEIEDAFKALLTQWGHELEVD